LFLLSPTPFRKSLKTRLLEKIKRREHCLLYILGNSFVLKGSAIMKRILQINLQIILLTVFLVGAVFAQDELIRVDTNLVSVNVTVTDAKGIFVRGLKPEQFEIFDNRVKQKIEYFSAEQAPVTFGIVYDMHPTTVERTTAVLESLKQFTSGLAQKDNFFIVAFNDKGSLNLDFIPTVEQVERQITPGRRKSEPRALYDAIYLAADKLRQSPSLKRTLLIISDSADHRSRHSFADLRNIIKSFDVQVYAVVLDVDSKWNYADLTIGEKMRRSGFNNANAMERAALSDLTLKSGGASHYPVAETSRELFDIYRKISSEIAEQYTISFTPGEADGKQHDLRVNLRGVAGSKKFNLIYRQTYQSPPPKNYR
jgi:Ca-activated chloride channel homolog